MSIEVNGIPQIKLPRAIFNRSKKRIGSYKPGLIYPIESKYVKPNDEVEYGFEIVARKLPTLAPSFAEERITVRCFFVPLRTLWDKWEDWQTGFKKYSDNTPFDEDVPRWTPQNIHETGIKTLWTHLGYPSNTLPDLSPADFKAQAYAWIHDTYFRFRPIQESILEDGKPGTWKDRKLLSINKDRDFFTTGLPQQQIGEAIQLPITGDTKAEFGDFAIDTQIFTDKNTNYKGSGANPFNSEAEVLANDNSKTGRIVKGADNSQAETLSSQLAHELNLASIAKRDKLKEQLKKALENNVVKMDDISSATISMIRHAFARQLQAENLARGGVFYPDVLEMNWGISPSNEILGLPLYLGGFNINMVNSEVLQTSATNQQTPLGTMGGHSLGLGNSKKIKYRAKEFGVFMAVMYIKNDNFYSNQGLAEEEYFIDNEGLGWVAYQHLSEQPVPKRSILCVSSKKPMITPSTNTIEWGEADQSAITYNSDTFFFMPINEHMRQAQNDVVGLLIQEQFYNTENENKIFTRNNLYNWSQAHVFSIEDGKRPAYNSDYLKFKADNRNYAVVTDNNNELEDNYIIWIKINSLWSSVLDKYGEPGQLDHIGVI